jgi:ParB family transcriptional regulator, chromosome partitioning protein
MKPLEEYQAYSIPVADIYYDAEFNCRGEFTLQSVKELADSIAEAGRLICPVAVQPWGKDGFEYRLVVGHRRLKAVTTFLKWAEIPAYICEGLSDHEARMLNFVENLERKNLNILEEARAIQKLYPDGVSLRHAAQELKQPTRWVHVRLRLLELPEEVQQKAAAGLLSAVNLDRIAGAEGPDDQIRLAREITEARERGKGKFLPGLSKTREQPPHTRRTKGEITRVIARMFDAGITGLAPRVAAWCAGNVSDEELIAEIEGSASGNTDGTDD